MTSKKIKIDIPREEGQVSIGFARGGSRAGAGRKGIGETKKVSLTLTPEAWEAIESRCNALQRSRSEVLREMIEAYFLPGASEEGER